MNRVLVLTLLALIPSGVVNATEDLPPEMIAQKLLWTGTDVGSSRLPLAIDEQTGRVFIGWDDVPNPPDYSAHGVKVLAGDTLDAIGTIPSPSGDSVLSVAVDSSRRRLFGRSSTEIWVSDLDTWEVVERIVVPHMNQGPYREIALNPSTNILYVSSVSDTDSGGMATIRLDAAPSDPTRIQIVHDIDFESIAFDPAANLAYLWSDWAPPTSPALPGLPFSECLVSVLDSDPRRPTWNTVVGSITTDGVRPTGSGGFDAVAINRHTKRLYVGGWVGVYEEEPDFYGPAVAVIDLDPGSPSYNSTIARVLVRPDPAGLSVEMPPLAIAVDPLRNRIYTTTTAAENGPFVVLGTISGDTNTRISHLSVSGESFNTWLGNLAVSPSSGLIYMSDAHALSLFHDPTLSAAATEAGESVAPVTVDTPQATITFADVVTAGETTIVPIDQPSSTLPGQFELAGVASYEITTTASVSSPITLCFNASTVTDPALFAGLAVLHGENGVLVDRTSSRDFESGTVCATVSSLSPFAVVKRKPYSLKPLYDVTRAFRSGSTAPIKLQVYDPTGDNVSSTDLEVKLVDIALQSTGTSGAFVDGGRTNPDSTFRYDPVLDGYIFNLSTKGLRGTYEVHVRIGADGRTYSLPLQVR